MGIVSIDHDISLANFTKKMTNCFGPEFDYAILKTQRKEHVFAAMFCAYVRFYIFSVFDFVTVCVTVVCLGILVL